jgi:FAD/FMN-containing dehydrogenase
MDQAVNPIDFLLPELVTLLGADHVVTEAGEREFFSTDVYRHADENAAVVLSPGTIDELAAAVALCTSHKLPVVPRGGGLSYTGGFLPVEKNTAIIDMRRLDRIIEVNAEDMYVTVECGATWKSLYEKLQPLGLRTPYFGPMSGYASSVGGALSQGSIFLGSTQYGSTAESVLSLSVVLADGSIINTGSASASNHSNPFFRHYGPDITGLFLHDAGALGFKAKVSLRLIKTPAASGFIAFTFPTYDAQLAAMSEIARRGLAAECFGADPYIWGMRLWDEDLSRDTKRLIGVIKSAPSLVKGLLAGAKTVLGGRKALSDVTYAMNISVDGNSQAAVEHSLAEIRKIVGETGTEIPATVPAAIRGTPFMAPNDLLGPKGQRWAPSHAIAPHSRIKPLIDGFYDFIAERKTIIEEHGIEIGYVCFAISTNCILFEPMFYWPGARQRYHERMISPAYLAKLPVQPPNPAADAAMKQLREDLVLFWAQQGCAHLQIGKTYRYLDYRQPSFRHLLEQLKAAVDPEGLVNPGSLGLHS